MTPEETELLEVVTAIKAEREEKRLIPTFAILKYVIPRLDPRNRAKCRETAQRLENLGRLKLGKTLNDEYLEIIETPTPAEQGDIFQNQESN